ncbi:TetR/AcrR family transcriptional regulator [Streptomyces sp. 8L]|uniref:TetR/AcrR family transcriptional regulator n=1 Tax=Streptomyces sp. 8L TaxID=2877242 RepID=UPI001CD71DEB|nr:TetR/AcrR family transcriptional regulator [Streptomyces sp. 8L]MCA1217568.1 TetR/AcrR family transcriptional regulator [Streptomyces sp. 8L]
MTSTQRRSKITPEREMEFYRAALDLLREGGYEALTMEGIAARTRCGKSTLYRQWRSKPQLVCAALRGTRGVKLKEIDTGSLAGDLRAVARATSAKAHRDTVLMHALVHAAQQNPDLLSALRENLIEPEVAEIDAMVRRAVDRGEVAPDNPAIEFVAVQLFGVMRARLLLRGLHADEDFMVRFIEASVLPALGVAAGPDAPVPATAPAGAAPAG